MRKRRRNGKTNNKRKTCLLNTCFQIKQHSCFVFVFFFKFTFRPDTKTSTRDKVLNWTASEIASVTVTRHFLFVICAMMLSTRHSSSPRDERQITLRHSFCRYLTVLWIILTMLMLSHCARLLIENCPKKIIHIFLLLYHYTLTHTHLSSLCLVFRRTQLTELSKIFPSSYYK